MSFKSPDRMSLLELAQAEQVAKERAEERRSWCRCLKPMPGSLYLGTQSCVRCLHVIPNEPNNRS